MKIESSQAHIFNDRGKKKKIVKYFKIEFRMVKYKTNKNY